jgi:hypothetical protein
LRWSPIHAQAVDAATADPTKFVAKKSKAAAKKGMGNSQVCCAAIAFILYLMFLAIDHARGAVDALHTIPALNSCT